MKVDEAALTKLFTKKQIEAKAAVDPSKLAPVKIIRVLDGNRYY